MRFWPRKTAEEKSIDAFDGDDDELLAFVNGDSSGGVIDALRTPAVSCAIRVISEGCAALDINLVHQSGPPKTVDDHPALSLLRGHANDWTSGRELVRDLVIAALTRDRGGLAWVNRTAGVVREVIQYKPGVISFQIEETGERLYRLSGLPVPAQDIVHLQSAFGKAPVTLARNAIAAAAAMEKHAYRMFANSARPGGVIEFAKGLGDAGLKKMRQAWQAAHEGPDNAGKTAVLWDGAKFNPLQLTSVDAQFNESRLFQLQEIARAFNIPAPILGELSRATWSNLESKHRELWTITIDPWLSLLEAAFNRALLTANERKTLTFCFDRDDMARCDLATRATAISNLIASETINPNTGRAWLGLPPYAGGDAYGNRNITVKPFDRPQPDGPEART